MELREKLIALSVLKNGNWFKMYDVLKDDNLSNNSKIHLVEDFDKVLSLDLLREKEIDNDLKQYIESKIEERRRAKENKNYALADQIRTELEEKGIII